MGWVEGWPAVMPRGYKGDLSPSRRKGSMGGFLGGGAQPSSLRTERSTTESHTVTGRGGALNKFLLRRAV